MTKHSSTADGALITPQIKSVLKEDFDWSTLLLTDMATYGSSTFQVRLHVDMQWEIMSLLANSHNFICLLEEEKTLLNHQPYQHTNCYSEQVMS